MGRHTLRGKVEKRGELSAVGHSSTSLSKLVEHGMCAGLHWSDSVGWGVLQ